MNATDRTVRTVLLGITGGIAAYKAVELASLLTKSGLAVDVVMTANACRFVTPRLLREVTGRPVYHDMWQDIGSWHTEHIGLAKRAKLVMVAPATANVIAKAAHGVADDLLSTVLLATGAPVIFAPAMNTNMYNHPATQENLRILAGRGCRIIPPDSGRLACGDSGVGRLPAPECLAAEICRLIADGEATAGVLAGRRVLVTAGGTREPIDPVRFIGNRSSGKMGVAIAECCRTQGAEVVLIAGRGVEVRPGCCHRTVVVETAAEMRDAVLANLAMTDAVVMAAAVADYRPVAVCRQKIKKQAGEITLTLIKNPDILEEISRWPAGRPVVVGFAAETENVLENGMDKLRRKNLDMIVINDVSQPGCGFDSDENQVVICRADGTAITLSRRAKILIAKEVIKHLAHIVAARQKEAGNG
ncbi:MAG: bifunctional phosphopantothenoylcysteine decarboxylase/phosphopantothenate--cysteine ligase CoaBC [Negativicutes bacterium]|nr:bifunctional phosphopantothenoylcysteine decarboxylase/phosphopantothenate--cysteine ligase CoaBC [Negativicutes bacterium]